jgi:hypothetical protein
MKIVRSNKQNPFWGGGRSVSCDGYWIVQFRFVGPFEVIGASTLLGSKDMFPVWILMGNKPCVCNPVLGYLKRIEKFQDEMDKSEFVIDLKDKQYLNWAVVLTQAVRPCNFNGGIQGSQNDELKSRRNG